MGSVLGTMGWFHPWRLLIKHGGAFVKAPDRFLGRQDLDRIHVVPQEIEAMAEFANECFERVKREVQSLNHLMGQLDHLA